MSNLICQSGYLCFLCQQKLSRNSDISIQSRKHKTVDEEPLCGLCSDQYIVILFVYLLIGHFTVVGGSEAEVDLVLIQTSLPYCVNQVILMLTSIFQEQFP